MARGWPGHGDISACEIWLFVEKLLVRGECPLFPKALVIGRVFRDLVPSRIAAHIQIGEHHDLLCRIRRVTTNGQYLHHR